MKSKKMILIATIIFAAACSPKLMEVTQTDADRGAAKFKTVTVASLSEGKTIFTENCNECHGLKSPGSKSEEKWNKIVPEMVKKLNQKMGKEIIDSKKQELLLQYLVTMSTAGKK